MSSPELLQLGRKIITLEFFLWSTILSAISLTIVLTIFVPGDVALIVILLVWGGAITLVAKLAQTIRNLRMERRRIQPHVMSISDAEQQV